MIPSLLLAASVLPSGANPSASMLEAWCNRDVPTRRTAPSGNGSPKESSAGGSALAGPMRTITTRMGPADRMNSHHGAEEIQRLLSWSVGGDGVKAASCLKLPVTEAE